ncbi:PI31 proteasome regulator N-terminal-domain-containing protein [Coniella lustricola]|uniref:PI31 proteasome regulator N-terminal-domain-containing protein n=1 Tax=Coniella lustricola TaxID=2025994 RepID=A0A2T3A1Z9_9PEZI|nr:PI31 proteasome regulator N-terminal-domain-containing protein [Coniella lustricola]
MADLRLDPQKVLQTMADALPAHDPDDTTSHLSSSAETVALFAYSCMVTQGFSLVGFHEDDKIEQQCATAAPQLLPSWNSSVSSYSFRFAHPDSAAHFILKTDRIGSKIEIRGLAIDTDNIARVEFLPRDYISSAALPLRMTRSGDSGQEDRSDLVSKFQRIFISPERVADLAKLIQTNIIQNLIPPPPTQKDGSQARLRESQDTRAAALEEADRAGREGAGRPPSQPQQPPTLLPDPVRPYPYDDPLAAPPRRPVPAADFPPPDFEDEFEMNRPPRGSRMPGDGRSPFNIGHDDLYPPGLAPHDPLRGSFVPGGGLPLPGGMGGGGGMHPTFDDPLFQGPGGSGGSGAFDPQAPPGARWDPVGPGSGPPRFGGGRRPGGGSGPFGGEFGGSGGNPFGGGFGGGII